MVAEVAQPDQGQFVGEMTLVDGQPRSATVITATPTRLLVLGLPELRRLCSSSAAPAHGCLHNSHTDSARSRPPPMVDQS